MAFRVGSSFEINDIDDFRSSLRNLSTDFRKTEAPISIWKNIEEDLLPEIIDTTINKNDVYNKFLKCILGREGCIEYFPKIIYK